MALQAEDDDRLKRTRLLWLFNKANLSPGQLRRVNAIKKHGLKTARAWRITDLFRWIWRHVYSESAHRFFKRWYAWAVRCRLRPVVKVARMLKRHLPNLLAYFPLPDHEYHDRSFNSVL